MKAEDTDKNVNLIHLSYITIKVFCVVICKSSFLRQLFKDLMCCFLFLFSVKRDF